MASKYVMYLTGTLDSERSMDCMCVVDTTLSAAFSEALVVDSSKKQRFWSLKPLL